MRSTLALILLMRVYPNLYYYFFHVFVIITISRLKIFFERCKINLCYFDLSIKNIFMLLRSLD
nr:hypothetical protein TDPV-002 [Oriental turtle dovepox virus]WIK87677.1 hypothetical protein TDPV-379 [Oriental turtle dovepox virus]